MSVEFTLNISSSNAAFVDDPKEEVSRILLDTLKKLEQGYLSGVCRDINGNLVGDWGLLISNDVD